MQAEAQILLGRLEQAWDTAVARGSASPMLRVIKMPADLSGLDRRTADRRAELWPLPDEALSGEALSGEALSGEALSCGTETANGRAGGESAAGPAHNGAPAGPRPGRAEGCNLTRAEREAWKQFIGKEFASERHYRPEPVPGGIATDPDES